MTRSLKFERLILRVLMWAGALVVGLIATSAQSQEQSGAIVAAIVEVDNFSGAAQPGCGGTNGNGLTATLNTASGTPGFDDENVALNQRRAAYRFCDIQTQDGGMGWTGSGGVSNGITSGALANQATSLAPEEIFAAMDDASSSFDLQTGNVARRISMLRLSRYQERGASEKLARRKAPTQTYGSEDVVGFDALGSNGLNAGFADKGERAENLLLALQDGINAGDETGTSGIGVFLNGRVHAIKGDENEAERGSFGSGGGFTLGADMQLNEQAYAGIALGYSHLGTRYDGNGSKTDLDAVAVTLYGAWYPIDDLYLDGSISTAWLGFDMKNDIIVVDGGTPISDIEGDTNGVNFGFDIGGGYSFAIEEVEGLRVEPFLRLNVLYTEIDDFSQSGGDGTLNLAIDSQNATSVTTNLGLRADYSFSSRLGVLTPYLSVAYVHEYNKENDDISASIAAIPGSDFKLKANATDSDYANVGVGLAATLGQGFSEFIDYDVIAGHDNVTVHQVTAGIRLEY